MSASTASPTRFILTGLPRVGSNLVLHSLADHPAVVAYNELFNAHRILWGSTPVDAELGETYLELRNTRPLVFLDTVLSPLLPEIRAVGFKLFYMQGCAEECENFRLVWPFLRTMDRLKVVDVVRKNRLEQAFSWIKARRTRVWVEKGQEAAASQQPLSIPFKELEGYFLWFDTMHRKRAELLAGMDALVVRYEDLAGDFPTQMARIQRHLGLEERPLPPATRKQRTIPLSRAIANYRELREAFARTDFLAYFEMSEADAACCADAA